MAFKCFVVTPDQQILDEMITQAIVPGSDGLVGVLTGRAPLLMKIGTGTLRIDRAGGQQANYFVDGGVAQMKGNKLTILTTDAIPAAEIDAASARAEYAEAEARNPTDAKTAADRQHQMARGRAKQALAGKR
jgi:F-type H+-transporting ATPase subunit epsilon